MTQAHGGVLPAVDSSYSEMDEEEFSSSNDSPRNRRQNQYKYDANGKIIIPKLRLPRNHEEEKREVMAIARVVSSVVPPSSSEAEADSKSLALSASL